MKKAMNHYSSILFAMIGFMYTSPLYADYFTIQYPNNDLSLTYLNFLFGPLATEGIYLQPNTLYYLITKILIFSLLFASLMSGWIIFIGTLRTAQEGKFLGQKLSSTSVIFRGMIGMGLVTPDSTGYAAIQKLLMTCILSGIGLANSLWSVVITQFEKGNALMTNSSYDSADQFVASQLIGQATLVSYLMQSGYIESFELVADSQNANIVQLVVTPIIPAVDPGPWNVFQLQSSEYQTLPSELISGLNNVMKVMVGDPFVQIFVEYIKTHPEKVIDLDALFKNLGIPTESANAWMIQNYNLVRNSLSIVTRSKTEGTSIQQYLEQGWIVAGSIYWNLSTTGSQKSYSDSLSVMTSLTVPVGSTNSLQTWLKRLYAPQFDGDATLSLDISQVQNDSATYGTNKMNGQTYASTAIERRLSVIDLSFNSLNDTFTGAANGNDPLMSFIKDCQRLMRNVIIFIMTSLLTAFTVVLAGTIASYTLPIGYQVAYLAGSSLLVLLSFATIFLPGAAMGGYYLPLIPVLIYSGGALAWYLQVIEAVVAAPFVAVALVQPTEDDFGKAEAALLLTLQVVLKPALMVMGLILGGRMTALGISLLAGPINAFLTFPKFVAMSSSDAISQFMVYLLMNQVVVYLVIAITTRCFSLVYRLPDQVFAWIKHRGGESDVRGMVSEARSGAEQSLQMIQQIFDIGSAVGRVALDAMSKVANKG